MKSRLLAFVLAVCTVMSLAVALPQSAPSVAAAFTGEVDRQVTQLHDGVTYTYVAVDESSPYGTNKFNYVEFDLAQQDLYVDLLQGGQYLVNNKYLLNMTEDFDASSEKTALASINGDLWMTSVHSNSNVTTSTLMVPRGMNILDGEILCSPQIDQEATYATNGEGPAQFWAFGVTDGYEALIGRPWCDFTVRNTTNGANFEADGLNRLPAPDAIVIFNENCYTTNYALSDAVEVVIDGVTGRFEHNGLVTGKVTAIASGGDYSLQEGRVILSARGSRASTLRNNFSVGDVVTISTSLYDINGDSRWSTVTTAIGGHMIPLHNGSSTGITDSTRYPASIVGVKDDGSVIFFQNDGRQYTSSTSYYSRGLCISHQDNILLELGVNTAMNLDGGGSSTMVVNKNSSFSVVNRPSDGSARKVINGLVVSYGPQRQAQGVTTGVYKTTSSLTLYSGKGSGTAYCTIPSGTYVAVTECSASSSYCKVAYGSYVGYLPKSSLSYYKGLSSVTAPSDLDVVSGETSLNLSWSSVVGAAYYKYEVWQLSGAPDLSGTGNDESSATLIASADKLSTTSATVDNSLFTEGKWLKVNAYTFNGIEYKKTSVFLQFGGTPLPDVIKGQAYITGINGNVGVSGCYIQTQGTFTATYWFAAVASYDSQVGAYKVTRVYPATSKSVTLASGEILLCAHTDNSNYDGIATIAVDDYLYLSADIDLTGQSFVSGESFVIYGSESTEVVVDTVSPVVTDLKVVSVTEEGYTLSCTVSDNVAVTKVQFPTWSTANNQSDLKWLTGTINGNTATCTVKISDFNNYYGQYTTHVYASDAAGNTSSAAGINVTVEETVQSLDLVSGSDYSTDGSYVTVSGFGATASEVSAQFVSTVFILDANGKEVSEGDAIGTGYTAEIRKLDGSVADSITLVVKGDLNGDAKVNTIDYIYLKLSVKGFRACDGAFKKAGDFYGDSLLNSTDSAQFKAALRSGTVA